MSGHPLRSVRTGDLVSRELLTGRSVRRNEATALVLPGAGNVADYLRSLASAEAEFAAWDGRITALPPDGEQAHRAVIVDRYGQVYEAIDAADTAGLPDAAALAEWFKFLATACPECGVLDDPIGRAWVP